MVAVVFAARALLRLFRLSFFTREDPHPRPRLRFRLQFFTLFPLIELFNAFCLLLDGLLFPGCRRARIREPIFIIGAPRSGTTILHRVMTQDEERFFFFRTWEIVFPSVLQKKVVSVVGRLDRLTGNRLRAALLRSQARRLEKIQHIHEIGLFLPEEDDKLFVHIVASMDLGWYFPYGGFAKMAQLDVAVDPRDQRRIMDFYLRCVRRQAYFKGGRRTLLSKNPMFSGKVANLLRCFPDCRFIYLVRNPLDVVPSSISLARVIVRSSLGIAPGAELDEQSWEIVRFNYLYPLDRLSGLPEDRFVVVSYDDLMRQPKEVTRRIYRQFGLTLTQEFERRLDLEAAKMARHKSVHEYSLDQCSVTRERIVTELRPIFDRFGFDTRDYGLGAAPAPPQHPARTAVTTGPLPLKSTRDSHS